MTGIFCYIAAIFFLKEVFNFFLVRKVSTILNTMFFSSAPARKKVRGSQSFHVGLCTIIKHNKKELSFDGVVIISFDNNSRGDLKSPREQHTKQQFRTSATNTNAEPKKERRC